MDIDDLKSLVKRLRGIRIDTDADLSKLVKLSTTSAKHIQRERNTDPRLEQRSDDEIVDRVENNIADDLDFSFTDAMESYGRVFQEISKRSIVSALPMLLRLNGRPFTLEDHFPMEPLFRTELPVQFLLRCGRQVSKCLAVGTEITLINGQSCRIEQLAEKYVPALNINFKLCNERILGIHKNGIRPVVLLRTRLGHVLRATNNHRLLTLNGYETIDELAKRFKNNEDVRVAIPRRVGEFTARFKPSAAELSFLALMLGDDCSIYNALGFTTIPGAVNNEFIRITRELGEFNLRTYTNSRSKAINYRFNRTSPLVPVLARYGLLGRRAWEKYIPAEIFDLSHTDTALFINRLWATNGCIKYNKCGITISFCSTSNTLIADLRRLLAKFGICASIRCHPAAYRNKDGIKINCRNAFVLRIETADSRRRFLSDIGALGKSECIKYQNDTNITNRDTLPYEINKLLNKLLEPLVYQQHNSLRSYGLRRKLKYPPTRDKLLKIISFVKNSNNYDKTLLDKLENLIASDMYWDRIIAIEPDGEAETFDLEIERAHNFIASGIVVHNSTSLAAQGVIQSGSTPYFNSLFVTPLYEQCRRFSSNYVRPFITDSPICKAIIDNKCEKSVLQRSFKNRSIMFFSYCLRDADRIRGIASDRITVDEIQDIDWDLLPVVLETMSASKWAIMQAAGTPKTLDNTIEKLWARSSQAEWVTRCEACNHCNIACIAQDLIHMIGRDTVVCAKCGRPINPRPSCHPNPEKRGTGFWLHAFPERLVEFPGYHAPQVIFPMHFSSPRKWRLLRQKMDASHTPRHVFINEVLGEGADMGTKLVTQADLISACKHYGKVNKIAQALLEKSNYLDVAIGVDWGGSTAPYGTNRAHLLLKPKEAQSYTALAIVGLKHDGRIDVLYVYRFDLIGNHIEEARACLQAWNAVDDGRGATLFCHDYGGGGSVRETLLIQAGLPIQNVCGCQYVHAPQQKMMEFKEKGARGYYSLDKARSLIFLCQAIKVGFVGLPEWISARDKLIDFLSLIEDTLERPGGANITRVVRKPGVPDDVSHAINFAACGLWQRHGYPDFKNILSLEEVMRRLDESAELISADHSEFNIEEI